MLICCKKNTINITHKIVFLILFRKYFYKNKKKNTIIDKTFFVFVIATKGQINKSWKISLF